MRLVIRKYDGDDSYSWAVFHKSDLPKGSRGTVFFGQAKPIACGLSRSQAGDCKARLEIDKEVLTPTEHHHERMAFAEQCDNQGGE